MTSRHPASVERVKGLGTTWYDRGTSYWVRRVWLSIVYLALAVGGGAGSLLILHIAWADDTVPRALPAVATLVGLGAAAGTAVVTWRAFRRSERASTPEKRRTAIRGGWSEVITIAAMTAGGALTLAACFFITFGGMTVTFVWSLRRDFFGERRARSRTRPRGSGTRVGREQGDR